MPVVMPTTPILTLHRQTARRWPGARQSRRREVGNIADRGGRSGVARVCNFADTIERRPDSCYRMNSLFGPRIPCSGNEKSLFGVRWELAHNVLQLLRELTLRIAETAEKLRISLLFSLLSGNCGL